MGRGVAGAAVGAGRGVTFGSPLTISTQPGSMMFGFVASDGWRSTFQAWSCPVVAPYERAIAARLSPARTVYSVPVGVAVGMADGVGDGDSRGEADGVPIGGSDGSTEGSAVAGEVVREGDSVPCG